MSKKMKNRLILLSVPVLLLTVLSVIVGVTLAPKSPAPAPQEQPTTAAVQQTSQGAVSVSPVMLTMGLGEPFTLAAQDDGGAAEGAVFQSDRPKILTADETTGGLTAAAEGYANVTVTAPNGTTAKSYVSVKKAPTAVEFPYQQVNMQKGETARLHLKPVSPDEGLARAAYRSGDEGVVTVTADGDVTAVGAGTATVTAGTYNNLTAEVQVTVLDGDGFTDATTIAASPLQQDASWSSDTLAMVPEYTTVSQYGATADGRWVKVRYNDRYGWMYNKAFADVMNYSVYDLGSLPVIADDLIFDNSRDKRAV